MARAFTVYIVSYFMAKETLLNVKIYIGSWKVKMAWSAGHGHVRGRKIRRLNIRRPGIEA